MAPPNSSSFSVRVVLPASGCEMMAKVRLFFISEVLTSFKIASLAGVETPSLLCVAKSRRTGGNPTVVLCRFVKAVAVHHPRLVHARGHALSFGRHPAAFCLLRSRSGYALRGTNVHLYG